jgi:hypothetical protein
MKITRILFVFLGVFSSAAVFAQQSGFTGKIIFTISDGKPAVKANPQPKGSKAAVKTPAAAAKPAKTYKMYVDGEKLLIDSVKSAGAMSRFVIDLEAGKLSMLNLEEKTGMSISLTSIVGKAEDALSKDTSSDNVMSVIKNAKVSFIKTPAVKTISGYSCSEVIFKPMENGAPKKGDSAIMYMTDKAGVRLTDFNPFFKAITSIKILSGLTDALSGVPESVKNSFPMEIRIIDSDHGSKSGIVKVTKIEKTDKYKGVFDTSGFTVQDLDAMMQGAGAEPGNK